MARLVTPGLVALALLACVSFPGCAHPSCPMSHEHPPPMMHAHMEEMAQRQAHLDQLVDTMNAVEGPAKVDAIAAVVSELASEHKAMHHHMQEMHGHMQEMQCEGPPR